MKHSFLKKSFLILASTCALPVFAQAKNNSNAGPFSDLFQLLFGFIAVLFLMGICIWFLKRLHPQKAFQKNPLQLVSVLSVGNRERILLIEIGEQWLVVGSTAQQLNTLASVPKQAALLQKEPGDMNKPFAQWLMQFRKKTESV